MNKKYIKKQKQTMKKFQTIEDIYSMEQRFLSEKKEMLNQTMQIQNLKEDSFESRTNGETWLVSPKPIKPIRAVIELSTKAVKFLVNLDTAILENNGFDFDSCFYRDSKRVEAGDALIQNQMDVMYFNESILPKIKWYACLAKKCYNVDVIHCVATAAYRQAKNRNVILNIIKNEVGLNVKILSKQEEATTTLWAYLFTTKFKNDFRNSTNHVMIDQGGGSTELSIFHNKELIYSYSFQVGTSLLKKQLFGRVGHSDLMEAIRQTVNTAVWRVRNDLGKTTIGLNMENCYCVGVGRSITMATGMNRNRDQHEYLLTTDIIQQKIQEYDRFFRQFATVADLQEKMIDDKIDKRLVTRLGLPIVLCILQHYGIGGLRVSGTGLFYGIFFKEFYHIQ